MYIYIYIIYVSFLKKRSFYRTKVSCYLQSSDILFFHYAQKITKICQNEYIK